ncbi:dynein regulatory complex subunit 4 isoform X2 [Hippoglossus stenolepis]|uniref:dynein regulatory complex subunit 4 isoform X2 n=1 Tax=Hippoglossus stenolepis TaxID=195615 RepID=UPI001FAFDD79|nr:dynein regulatory complex subunit 4 isoform X2 [Hippoglossus stenolepis]
MPPKNKGSGKKPAKTRTPTLIDGLTKEELSKEQMEEHIVRLREELDREREERNYFQLERDTIQNFSENTKRELQEMKAEMNNLEKDIEEDERCHQVEIKVFNQKMKHLLCEHQNTISELRANALVSTEMQQKEQETLETELHKRMKAIKVEMEEIDDEHLVKELELKHAEEMTEVKDKLEKQLRETEAVYEGKTTFLLQELDNMRKNGISEKEDHWNSHIDVLISDHSKALREASELVKDLQQVLEGNDSFKTQMKEMKMKQKQEEKDLILLMRDNKRLAEHLSKAEEEIAEKKKKMKHSAMKKEDTKEKIIEKKMNDLKQDYETLQETFDKLQLERDELYKTHSQSIQRAQHKADLKHMQLETKLKALTDSLEKTNAQLHSVLTSSNMDQTGLREVINNIQENLDSDNNTIKILQYKKDQISKAREDLLLYYKAKLRALGVPVEELRAEPFESSRAGKIRGRLLDLGFAQK